jgi:FAD:protein FMN transferase
VSSAMTSPSARGGQDTVPVHRRVEHVMGMPISLAVRGRHAGDALSLAAWDRAVAVLRDVDRVFSTYRSDSYISRLGRGELAVADCPPEVEEVLALAEQARVESDGAFDVRREDPDGAVVLDPSGVVKGWAVQRAASALATLPDTDFALSAGGDMVCRVAHADAPAWQVGVEDPRTSDRVVAVIPVRNGAVATSGLSRRGEHIVDARTGQVPTGVLSVTVVTDNLTWADIDATAAFAHGPDAVRWLSTRPRRQGVVVWADRGPEVFSSAA